IGGSTASVRTVARRFSARGIAREKLLTSMSELSFEELCARLDAINGAGRDLAAGAAAWRDLHRAELARLCRPRYVDGLDGALLRWGREESGLSLAEVAQAVGVVTTTVACWEAGTASPTLDQLQVLCDLYRV